MFGFVDQRGPRLSARVSTGSPGGESFMLTRKQYELLMYIQERLGVSGVSPSFEEMKEALGLKSKSSIHRLIDPQGMGSLFKVIAFGPNGIAPLSGFEAMPSP